MARTDYVEDVPRVSNPDANAKRLAAREEKERLTEEREVMAAGVTEGILGEAMSQGFTVHDTTKEALSAPPAVEEPEAPEAPAQQDAVDAIIAGLESNTTEVADAWDEDEEEPETQMPDFEAEADREILDREIASAEEEYEVEEGYEEANPAELKRAIIAEKKAAFYEGLTADRERRKWEAEATKHFPFSKHALGGIKAKSRRGYLKEAKAAHEAVKPYIKAATEARLAEVDAERAGMAAQERAKAEAAWGKPHAGPSAPQAPSKAEADYELARSKQDLAGMIAAQMFASNEGGEVE